MSKRYCLALDLKEDKKLIKEYEELHKKVSPDILKSISDSGILAMDIYRVENRLFMIMEVVDSFSFEKKANIDENSEKVKAWEELTWKYQKALPGSRPGEKWRLMDQIFEFKS